MKYFSIDHPKYWFEDVGTIDAIIDILQLKLNFYTKAKAENVSLTEDVDNGYIFLGTENENFAKECSFEEVEEDEEDEDEWIK